MGRPQAGRLRNMGYRKHDLRAEVGKEPGATFFICRERLVPKKMGAMHLDLAQVHIAKGFSGMGKVRQAREEPCRIGLATAGKQGTPQQILLHPFLLLLYSHDRRSH